MSGGRSRRVGERPKMRLAVGHVPCRAMARLALSFSLAPLFLTGGIFTMPASAQTLPAAAVPVPAPVPVIAPTPVPAKDESGILSVSIENDLFASTDRHYTNGIRLSYLSAESAVPDWLDRAAMALPIFSQDGRRRWGLSFGQSMYAPSDLTRRNPDPTDQPYAGWLYGSIGVVSEEPGRIDILEMDLGMVGPSSLAAARKPSCMALPGRPGPRAGTINCATNPASSSPINANGGGFTNFRSLAWAPTSRPMPAPISAMC